MTKKFIKTIHLLVKSHRPCRLLSELSAAAYRCQSAMHCSVRLNITYKKIQVTGALTISVDMIMCISAVLLTISRKITVRYHTGRCVMLHLFYHHNT